MNNGLSLPSVRAIQVALDEVPGALREQDPISEDAGIGNDPATEIWISDPDLQAVALDSPGLPTEDDRDDGWSDEPAVIFEVPPNVTDSDVTRILGDERFKELQQLQQIRGIDALAWYVTFHQRKFQYGVHIPLEGVLLLAVGVLGGYAFPLNERSNLPSTQFSATRYSISPQIA